MADIQQMFHCLYFDETDRNYLRFCWHIDNDPTKDIIDYRMCVHIFENSPLPIMASNGMSKITFISKKEFGEDVNDFVTNKLYVASH